jgi:alkanesulfonate monooxygenase
VTRSEIAWFSALCDDDYRQLGVVDESLRSSYEHCGAIVREAEAQGFDSILLPSGYALGLDTTAMAAALAVTTSRIRLLTALRTG